MNFVVNFSKMLFFLWITWELDQYCIDFKSEHCRGRTSQAHAGCISCNWISSESDKFNFLLVLGCIKTFVDELIAHKWTHITHPFPCCHMKCMLMCKCKDNTFCICLLLSSLARCYCHSRLSSPVPLGHIPFTTPTRRLLFEHTQWSYHFNLLFGKFLCHLFSAHHYSQTRRHFVLLTVFTNLFFYF